MRKVKNVIYLVVVLFLTFVAIILFVPPILGWQNLVVYSDSMEPTLHINDLICVAPCEFEEVKLQDIITFKDRNGGNVTHRVYEIQDGEIVTKGDANAEVDAYPVDQEHLIGKMKYHIPYLGRLVRFLNRK